MLKNQNNIFVGRLTKIKWNTNEPIHGGLYIVTVLDPDGSKSIQVDSWDKDKKQWETYKRVRVAIAWFDMEDIIPYE